MVEPDHRELSLRRQCALLGLNRATLYYAPAPETALNLHLMRLMDEQYLKMPWLRGQDYSVNPKRVRRLLRKMGLEALYPKPKTTKSGEGHKTYPYLLRNL